MNKSTKNQSKSIGFWSKIQSWWRVRKLKHHNSQLGKNVACYGQMNIENRGQLTIGEQTVFRSDFQATRLAIGENARLTIGNNCFLNSVILAVSQEVKIGDNCSFAPFVHLMDSDFHDLEDRNKAGKAAPIIIGQGVQLGARVIVLRGVKIGDNAIVLPGTVVVKDVAAGDTIAGVPGVKL